MTGSPRRPAAPRRIGVRAAAGGRGFTLVEVLVALMIVALGLTALMTTVSGTARTSGYLRDKAVAQWIGLNRLAEVRLHLQATPGANGDTGELDFANRKWHYDTRYFDTSTPAMRRVIVRVWPGPADQKGSPLAETSGFLGTSIAPAGNSNTFYQTLGGGPTAPAPNGAAGTNVTKPTTGAPAAPGAPVTNAPVLTPNTTTTPNTNTTTSNP